MAETMETSFGKSNVILGNGATGTSFILQIIFPRKKG